MTPQEYGMEKVAYSIREAAGVLSVGRTAVYALIRAGDLQPIKPGKKNLILAVEMATLLDKWRAMPAKQHAVQRRRKTVLQKKAEAQETKGRKLNNDAAEMLKEPGL